jgi:glyoxylase-like metal-dependent hydrolase (beta-lactamase superfamily II)
LPAAGQLPAGVAFYPTPGHAVGHCSLLIDTQWGSAVVAGDAVMTRDYYRAEEGFHNSVDFEQATATIQAIKRTAKLVIPGHDNLILAMTPQGR